VHDYVCGLCCSLVNINGSVQIFRRFASPKIGYHGNVPSAIGKTRYIDHYVQSYWYKYWKFGDNRSGIIYSETDNGAPKGSLKKKWKKQHQNMYSPPGRQTGLAILLIAVDLLVRSQAVQVTNIDRLWGSFSSNAFQPSGENVICSTVKWGLRKRPQL